MSIRCVPHWRSTSSTTGHMPAKFPTDQWIKAVQWHGDSKVVAVVNTEAEWADAKTLLAPLENVVVEAESKQGAVVWSSAQKDLPAIPTDSLPLKLVVLMVGCVVFWFVLVCFVLGWSCEISALN